MLIIHYAVEKHLFHLLTLPNDTNPLFSWCDYIQFKKGTTNLQQQHVGMVVLVYEHDAFHRAPHALLVIVLLHALQARSNRGVLLEKGILDAKGIVGF